VGVDLLPSATGWTVVELNGAVDFTDEYSLGRDVFAAVTFELARAALGCPRLPVEETASGTVWGDGDDELEGEVATLVD
jgi:hypothetical protein